MKKLFPIFILVFGISFNIYAQNGVCKVKRANLPAVRGLKLDMPKSDVLKLYPSMQIVDKEGVQYGTISKSGIRDSEQQKGVEAITAAFVKGNLASVMITYDQNVTWNSGAEFAEYVGESMQLPILGWTNLAGANRKMVCTDFVISGSLNKENKAVLFLIKPDNEFKMPVKKN